MEAIAHIESPFKEKFGVPRQSGLAPEVRSRIVFEEKYRNPEALRGLEGFDYIWLIWEFSGNGPRWEPTVRPPRLGGNKRMGVFATRSTFRPNALGLSSVKLEGIVKDPVYGMVLEISGADLMDGTPILDIKPYVTYADAHPEAASGWVDDVQDKRLKVVWEAEFPDGSSGDDRRCPESGIKHIKTQLEEVLTLDPRPSYKGDSDREYGLSFAGYNIRFRVEGTTLTVTSCTF